MRRERKKQIVRIQQISRLKEDDILQIVAMKKSL